MTLPGEATGPKWATATSTKGQRTIVFRFVSELGAQSRHAQQPARIFLVWRFESETGMPSSVESERMSELEDALAQHVEDDGFATLAIVSTGDGLREWTYYADSGDEFVERLNVALGDLPPFPIEIHDALDPDWKYYSDFLANLTGEATALEE
jgi:hypothetical protein